MKFFPKWTLSRASVVAILVALSIVVGLLSFGTNIWQISLTFIVNTLLGAVGGPILAGIGMAISDILSTLFFGHFGYFPGYTFSAFIVGILYGLFFFGRRIKFSSLKSWIYVFVAVAVIMLVDTVFFNSLWVSVLYKMKFEAAVVTRLPLLIQIPFRAIVILIVLPLLQEIPQIARLMLLKEKTK